MRYFLDDPNHYFIKENAREISEAELNEFAQDRYDVIEVSGIENGIMYLYAAEYEC